MQLIPAKNEKGIWTLAILIFAMVLVMFLNTYAGPNRQPLFGFMKKAPAAV